VKKGSELEARWDSQMEAQTVPMTVIPMDSELGRSLEILRVRPKSVLAMVSYSEYPLDPRKASQKVHLMSAILMVLHLGLGLEMQRGNPKLALGMVSYWERRLG